MKLKNLLLGLLMSVFLIASLNVAFAEITIGVDGNLNDTWGTSNNSFPVNFTVISNISTATENVTCKVWATKDGNSWQAWDDIANHENATAHAVVNNSQVTINATTNASSDTNTSDSFIFGVACNGTVQSDVSVNRTSLGIDWTPPDDFACAGFVDHDSFLNGTRFTDNAVWTDYTPTPRWLASSDQNFSRFELRINESQLHIGEYDAEYNITDASTTSFQHNLSNTTEDLDVEFWITAYDKAGVQRNVSNCSGTAPVQYYTDYTCANLKDGWNLCGIVRDGPVTAQQICSEVDTCDFIAMYNSTGEFSVYTNGSTTNENLTFRGSDVLSLYEGSVFIHTTDNTTWQNRTWEINNVDGYVHQFGNGTDKAGEHRGWNIVPVTNRTCSANLSLIDRSISGDGGPDNANFTNTLGQLGNVSFMSYYNNSVEINRFKPFVANWTFNGGITPTFGEAFWGYWNNDTGVTNYTYNSTDNNVQIC